MNSLTISPTKQQEIDILDKAIELLTDRSYLGPALKNRRGWLVGQIQSDMPIDLAEDNRQLEETNRNVQASLADHHNKCKVAREELTDLNDRIHIAKRQLEDAQRSIRLIQATARKIGELL